MFFNVVQIFSHATLKGPGYETNCNSSSFHLCKFHVKIFVLCMLKINVVNFRPYSII